MALKWGVGNTCGARMKGATTARSVCTVRRAQGVVSNKESTRLCGEPSISACDRGSSVSTSLSADGSVRASSAITGSSSVRC